MSLCVSPVQRLLLTTLLILLIKTIEDVETFAIKRPESGHSRIQNLHRRVALTQIQNNSRDSKSISTKREIKTPATFDVDIDATDSYNRSETNRNYTSTEAVSNINEATVEKTDDFAADIATAEGTTQSNIFSVPTRRARKLSATKTAPPLPSSPPTTPSASTPDVMDSRGLSMVDVDEESDSEIKTKYRSLTAIRSTAKDQPNGISYITKIARVSASSSKTNIILAPTNYSLLNETNMVSNGPQKSQSNIYKINSNYKRYKKLNIVPPKPLWRDPNDNSWRNESISSLGIKFKPTQNTTKPFQLRKKDLSELDTSSPEPENSTNPGLRERLEKLSEIRKSKKKFNMTSMESREENLDYDFQSSESPPVDSTPFIQQETTRQSRMRSTTLATKLYTELVKTMKTKESSEKLQTNVGNSYYITNKIKNATNLVKSREKSDPLNGKDNTERANKDFEKVIANSNYHETEYIILPKKPQKKQSDKQFKNNQFDYNFDAETKEEYEDYELNITKDLLNSSQTWSEKEPSTEQNMVSYSTESSEITQYTRILDSLTEYLNTNKPTTPIAFEQNAGDSIEAVVHKIDNYNNNPTESATISQFTDNIDLPIGPRNKDGVSVPRSYSYNTIPHKEMSVRYNTTVIHYTTQKTDNNYNTLTVTESIYGSAASQEMFPTHDSIRDITNVNSPESYDNREIMPLYAGGHKEMFENFAINQVPEIKVASAVKTFEILQSNNAEHGHILSQQSHHGPEGLVSSLSSIQDTNFKNTVNLFPIVENHTYGPTHQSLVAHDLGSHLLNHHINNQAPLLANIQEQIGSPQGYEPLRPELNPANSAYPILYNNTVLHGSSGSNGALSNSYIKGVYEGKIAAGTSAPPAEQQDSRLVTPDLSPDYHAHYYVADESSSPTKKLVSPA